MVKNKLKEVLISFLKEEEVYYPEIKVSILSVNPFQFSDDDEFYFESQNLQEIYYSANKTCTDNKNLIIV